MYGLHATQINIERTQRREGSKRVRKERESKRTCHHSQGEVNDQDQVWRGKGREGGREELNINFKILRLPVHALTTPTTPVRTTPRMKLRPERRDWIVPSTRWVKPITKNNKIVIIIILSPRLGESRGK